jgi:hypothetical protein
MYLLQFLFVVGPLSVRQPQSDPSTPDSARRKEATWNSDKYVGTDEYIYHRIYHEIFETALVWYVLTPPGFWHAATVVHNLIHRRIYLPKSDVIYLVTSTARETPLVRFQFEHKATAQGNSFYHLPSHLPRRLLSHFGPEHTNWVYGTYLTFWHVCSYFTCSLFF